MNWLTVGAIAKKAKVNVQTLHYYEKRGLLKPSSRRESGYRLYGEDAVKTLNFIKHAQELGFTLDEIKALLNLRANKKEACAKVQSKAEAHLEDVESKIERLSAMKRTLQKFIGQCRKQRLASTDCPFLELLENEDVF